MSTCRDIDVSMYRAMSRHVDFRFFFPELPSSSNPTRTVLFPMANSRLFSPFQLSWYSTKSFLRELVFSLLHTYYLEHVLYICASSLPHKTHRGTPHKSEPLRRLTCSLPHAVLPGPCKITHGGSGAGSPHKRYTGALDGKHTFT